MLIPKPTYIVVIKFQFFFLQKNFLNFFHLETIMKDFKKKGAWGRAQTSACLSGKHKEGKQVSYKFRTTIQGRGKITLPTP